jgi:hypothetical protein
MLSTTFIKNYISVERFSFYKGNSEYLISPYTHFEVKKKEFTRFGKYHLYLSAKKQQK